MEGGSQLGGKECMRLQPGRGRMFGRHHSRQEQLKGPRVWTVLKPRREPTSLYLPLRLSSCVSRWNPEQPGEKAGVWNDQLSEALVLGCFQA